LRTWLSRSAYTLTADKENKHLEIKLIKNLNVNFKIDYIFAQLKTKN